MKTFSCKKNNSGNTKNIYIVKSGDSLYSISKKFNTTVDDIKKVNNLTSLKEFADVNKFDECFRTSAKTGLNINESMKYLIESILKRMSKITSNDFSPDRISCTLDPSKHNNNANLRSQQKGECC